MKPNVVFVLTDDQGYPPLGCHGHPFVQTPEIDHFHENAVRFEQFHSGTTCAPTRAGIMTGHYCNSTGVWHTIGGRSLLRDDEWTLPQALKENGYNTGMFGKWHLGDSYPLRPQDRGFDRVVCHGGGGIAQQPDWWGNDYFDDTYMVDGTPTPFKGYCTDVFFDEGIKFIKEQKNNPFFCYISTNAPHRPLNVEKKYWEPYMEHTGDERYARFLGMITNIDENFGRLRKKLAELEIEDNTILIFMSDNGQALLGNPDTYNAGMRGGKGSEYDGGHRIPFILRWPGGGMGQQQEINTLTNYTDFMPTILDMCGAAVPPERTFHGESMLPLMKGAADDHWNQRCIATDTQRIAHPVKWIQSCVMKNKWRLVNRHELYDIQADPSQKKDIAASHPALVHELQAAYEEWWELCARQFDDDVPYEAGSPDSPILTLRTHDLRNEQSLGIPWNQGGIRNGETGLGYWPVRFSTGGRYRFTLRRWPEEAGRAITAGINGDDVVWNKEGVEEERYSFFTGGKALNINSACLSVKGYPRISVDVGTEDKTAVLELDLEAGCYEVRAWFLNLNGKLLMAAYYVDIEKI